MARPSFQDRLASATSNVTQIIHEARLDCERKRIEYERAVAALVDAENAARRIGLHANAARRPRHLQPGERDEGPTAGEIAGTSLACAPCRRRGVEVCEHGGRVAPAPPAP